MWKEQIEEEFHDSVEVSEQQKPGARAALRTEIPVELASILRGNLDFDEAGQKKEWIQLNLA